MNTVRLSSYRRFFFLRKCKNRKDQQYVIYPINVDIGITGTQNEENELVAFDNRMIKYTATDEVRNTK